MIQPERQSKNLLAITRAKAKMYEYDVPPEYHIDVASPLTDLIDITVAMLGDVAASPDGTYFDEEKYKLVFSARYLDALIGSETVSTELNYLRLLAASAYYLSSYPGSSMVVLKQIANDIPEFCLLQKILLSVLRREEITIEPVAVHDAIETIQAFRDAWNSFLQNGTQTEVIRDLLAKLRQQIYADGSDRDVFIVDILRAVAIKIIASSAWSLLPENSSVTLEQWTPYLSRRSAVKELWPSQIILAKNGVFNGTSAVIQMPTSAGKTKAAELIIRSSFLSNRSSLAVIVAPFRALCQEIFNDLSAQFASDRDVSINIVSDVLQNDLEDVEVNHYEVLVLTPEKLDYLLRHNNDISPRIGLIIYDEGHLFDDTTRGAKYELLLASLKKQLPNTAQTILISAVISNAQQIKDWLIGNTGVVIEGKNLNPTNRSIAFASWIDQRGRLEFMNEEDIDQALFFVPRVMESQELSLRGRERVRKFFPAKDTDGIYKSNHVAVFLGCKLSSQGLSAIFTGRKDSALNIAKDLVYAYEHEWQMTKPIEYVNQQAETNKLINYIERVLGADSIQAKAAKLGVLIHHGSTPHGLRLSIELALQRMRFRSVVCTSTLAQGVNLPIRYLIIATDRQGRDRIKVRDFHNLMGRAGRSGFYTEGTVIFANPRIYDRRYRERWNWDNVKQLINVSNSESCKSRLLDTFEPEPADDFKKAIWNENKDRARNEINSYLLNALSDITDIHDFEHAITDLVQNTLAYFQSDDQQKASLVDIFLEIGRDITIKEPVPEKRKIFAKSVLNLEKSQELLISLTDLLGNLGEVVELGDILSALWSILYEHSRYKTLRMFSKEDSLTLCQSWISGESFPHILERCQGMTYSGRKLTLDHVVDLCEGAFSFDLSLVVGSISELSSLILQEENQNQGIKSKLYFLQKVLKYGLPNKSSISLYEVGFSDRQLSMYISDNIADNVNDVLFAQNIRDRLIIHQEIQTYIRDNYPEYFTERLDKLLE
ncbi:MAG: DEAD/DEAH box helicase [Patescibacteria group bacterium]